MSAEYQYLIVQEHQLLASRSKGHDIPIHNIGSSIVARDVCTPNVFETITIPLSKKKKSPRKNETEGRNT